MSGHSIIKRTTRSQANKTDGGNQPIIRPTYTAIDLFCGAGGATQGLRQAGLQVLLSVELDANACATYRLNHPGVTVLNGDICAIDPQSVRCDLGLQEGDLTVLKLCPPCQSFSTLTRRANRSNGNRLVVCALDWAAAFLPHSIMLENVSGISSSPSFSELCDGLTRLGYQSSMRTLDAAEFGVPQSRKRLILVALRSQVSPLPDSFWAVTNHRVSASSVLARLKIDQCDSLNLHRSSSPAVRRRIEAVPINGGRFDLPSHLQLPCHKRLKTRSATASYGRIGTAGPAPTMTTRCTTPACGQFIHPWHDRGLTLREAAVLQSFPQRYGFLGNYGDIERQIGNAVPPRLVAVLVRRLIRHLKGKRKAHS